MDRNGQNHQLPFKVGQLAESRSFIPGFRSAWFRCKIKDIKLKKRRITHFLEFFDFPDEKLRWTQIYQKNQNERYLPPQERKLHLMVRPCFPPLYNESQMPDLHKMSGILAIAVDEWKVGDLVDWWSDGCYWSGRITCLLGNEQVQIELPEPPWGEGKSYEACTKDLRPSLEWSPELGWTVPISTDTRSSHYCARLIQPLDQEKGDEYPSREDAISVPQGESGDSSEYAAFGSSYGSADSFLPSRHEVTSNEAHTAHASKTLDREHKITFKGSCSDGTSIPHHNMATDALHATTRAPRAERYEYRGPSETMRIDEDDRIAPLFRCDTIESSILGLEELAIKIKWVKGILKFGPRSSDSTKPSWMFLENTAFTRR